METINISEAKSRFSELMSRAAGGEQFIIVGRAQSRVILMGARELTRLKRAAKIGWRLAQVLGQSTQLLKQIEAGKAHPAMAAFGLWKDERDLDNLETQIIHNRQRTSSASEADL